MAKKKIHINEERFKLLFERISDKLWHFTQPSTVLAILKTNKIGCTFSQNRSDAYSNKHLYYICMSRTRTVYDNSWGENKVARIQFDGYELNKHYSGRPINYYGWSKGGFQERGAFEYEDRIFSDKPYIDNASKYITRIDLLYNIEQANNANTYKEILQLSKETGIPVYFYDNKKDYSRQTDNTINDEIENLEGPENAEQYMRRVSFPDVLTELFAIRYVADSDKENLVAWNPYGEESRSMVESYLSKYGFEKYTDAVLKELHYTTPFLKLRDSKLSFLANSSDIRQAHMISQSPKEGEMLQKMAIDLMKEFGESSIDRLIANIVNDKYSKKKFANEARMVIKTWQGSSSNDLIDGDETMTDAGINASNYIDAIRYCLMDDENHLDQGEDVGYDGYERKIWHKSKSNESLIAYLRKKFNNGKCSVYDFADTIYKLFRGNEEKMKEEFGLSFKPITVTKDEFARNGEKFRTMYNGMGYYSVVKKLFGSFDGLTEYEKEHGIS